jgi:hypothetical protein
MAAVAAAHRQDVDPAAEELLRHVLDRREIGRDANDAVAAYDVLESPYPRRQAAVLAGVRIDDDSDAAQGAPSM